MLHIFLFILKLIGWVLLLILGLLLLVIVAALFTPLRYHVETRCQGKLSTLETGINFRILFRLISGSIQYRDGNLDWNIRAAWIRMGSQADAEDMEEVVEETTETREKTEGSKKPDNSEESGNAEKKEDNLEQPGNAGEKASSDGLENSKEKVEVSEELPDNPSDSMAESKSADRQAGKKKTAQEDYGYRRDEKVSDR